MTVFLNQADLAFLLAAVDPATGGSNPPPGTTHQSRWPPYDRRNPQQPDEHDY